MVLSPSREMYSSSLNPVNVYVEKSFFVVAKGPVV